MIRDLEDEDLDDLELQMDQDQGEVDDEAFQNELLFNVQGLGSIKKINSIDIYVKGRDCEDCIKDLCRACRRDDKVKMRVDNFAPLLFRFSPPLPQYCALIASPPTSQCWGHSARRHHHSVLRFISLPLCTSCCWRGDCQ